MGLEVRNTIIPDHIVNHWQHVVDAVADLLSLPSVMINRLEPPDLEVFCSNISPNNPFPSGTRMPMAGVYCAMTAKKHQKLQVNDARNDPQWADSPTAKAGIYAYLGYPLLWPDGEVFGTLCVVDTKENSWGKHYENLLFTFKDVVEDHLALVSTLEMLDKKNRELECALRKSKQMEEALTTERQRLTYILEGTNVGTWEYNVQTGEAIVNERLAEISGYTLAELTPISIETFMNNLHPDDLAASSTLLEKIFNKELTYIAHEVRVHHKDGRWIWVLDRGKVAIWTADGNPLVVCGTRQDITERKQAEEKIHHLANHDALTGLPSLRLARDRLAMAMNHAHRYNTMAAVMFIDLDGFKTVNDTLGHDAGDEVLKHVAQRLLACVRETDTVARIGGDEFLLIATGLHTPENASQIAEKVIQFVSQPIIFNGRQAVVGASIGIALFPDHGNDKDQLIKQADEAMYSVKNASKNGFGFVNTARLYPCLQKV